MVWLIGCSGLLGKELGKALTENKINWIGTDSKVDVTVPSNLTNFADSHGQDATRTGESVSLGKVQEKISWIINCSALSNVEEAEENPTKAKSINVDGTRNIARTARQIGAKLIHISTDYVFDGQKDSPYTENDLKNPLNVYGTTKSEAEDIVKKESTQYYIIRTSWLYGNSKSSFTSKMIELMESGTEINVSDRQKSCPTSAESLSRVIIKILQTSIKAHSLFGKKSALPYGIYHYCDCAPMSRYEFAREIYEAAKKYSKISSDCTINPVSVDDPPMTAKRPSYSVLSCEKLMDALGLKKPDFKQNLEKFIKNADFNALN